MFTQKVSAQSECFEDHMDDCNSGNEADKTSQGTTGSLRIPAFETSTSRWVSRSLSDLASSDMASLFVTSHMSLKSNVRSENLSACCMLSSYLPVCRSTCGKTKFVELRHLLVDGLGGQSNNVNLCAICDQTLPDSCQRTGMLIPWKPKHHTLLIMKPSPLLPPVTSAT